MGPIVWMCPAMLYIIDPRDGRNRAKYQTNKPKLNMWGSGSFGLVCREMGTFILHPRVRMLEDTVRIGRRYKRSRIVRCQRMPRDNKLGWPRNREYSENNLRNTCFAPNLNDQKTISHRLSTTLRTSANSPQTGVLPSPDL